MDALGGRGALGPYVALIVLGGPRALGPRALCRGLSAAEARALGPGPWAQTFTD